MDREVVKKLYCPNPLCSYEFGSNNWDNYTIGIKDEFKLYRCPGCGFEFTVKDCQLNAIDITGSKETDDFFFFDQECNLLFRIAQLQAVIVDKKLYLTVPCKILEKTFKIISMPCSITDKDGIVEYTNYIKNQKEKLS